MTGFNIKLDIWLKQRHDTQEGVNMSFKAGDFVIATENTPYEVTNSNMLLGIVMQIDGESMVIKVLAHRDIGETGFLYKVLPMYFEPVENHPVKYIFENYNYDINGALYNLPFFILTNYYCSLLDLAMDIGVLYSEHPEYNVKELLHCASVKLKWASIYKKS